MIIKNSTMKQIYLFLLFIATSVALHAQTSGLYVYDGGYFIKNGDSWEEYRPKDKAELGRRTTNTPRKPIISMSTTPNAR